VQVQFWDFQKFVDTENNTFVQKKTVYHELVTQVPLGRSAEILKDIGNSITISMTSILSGNFALNLLLAGSLSYIWSMIRAQQIIVHLPLTNIVLPGNAAYFFSFLMNIAAFDIIPTDELFDELFKYENKEPPTIQFGALGYETVYFIRNLGPVFVFI